MRIKATFFTVHSDWVAEKTPSRDTVVRGSMIRVRDMAAPTTQGLWVHIPAKQWVEHDVHILQFLPCGEEDLDAVVVDSAGKITRVRTDWLLIET